MRQVARMAEKEEAHRILVGKFIGQRTLGKTKT